MTLMLGSGQTGNAALDAGVTLDQSAQFTTTNCTPFMVCVGAPQFVTMTGFCVVGRHTSQRVTPYSLVK